MPDSSPRLGNSVPELYGEEGAYYDQNLPLFSMGRHGSGTLSAGAETRRVKWRRDARVGSIISNKPVNTKNKAVQKRKKAVSFVRMTEVSNLVTLGSVSRA